MVVRVICSSILSLSPAKKTRNKVYRNAYSNNLYHAIRQALKYSTRSKQFSSEGSGNLSEGVLSDLQESIEPGGSEGLYLYYNQEQDVEAIVANMEASLGEMEGMLMEDMEETLDENYTPLLEQIIGLGSPKLEILEDEDAEVKNLANIQITPEKISPSDPLAPVYGTNAAELFSCLPLQELVKGIITTEGLCFLYLN